MVRAVRDEGQVVGGKAVTPKCPDCKRDQDDCVCAYLPNPVVIDQIVRQQEEIEDLRRRLADSVAKQEALSNLVEQAFREGFRSVATYNDTVLNDEDEEWRKYWKGLIK